MRRGRLDLAGLLVLALRWGVMACLTLTPPLSAAWAQDGSPFDGRWALDQEASDDASHGLEGPPGAVAGLPQDTGGTTGTPRQESWDRLNALLAASERVALAVIGDRLLISWQDGEPRLLVLGQRPLRVKLQDGQILRIRAWSVGSELGGALLVRRRVGTVLIEEEFQAPVWPGEMTVMVSAQVSSLSNRLDIRRVYRAIPGRKGP